MRAGSHVGSARRVRLLIAAGALLAGAAATAGPALVPGSPAAASTTSPTTNTVSTTTDTVPVGFTCSTATPVPLSGLAVTVPVTVTAPTSVPAGASFAVPWALTLAPLWSTPVLTSIAGGTVTFDAVTVGVDATNATPSSEAEGATGLPVTVADQASAPLPFALAPLTLTAGTSAAPVLLTAGDLSITITANFEPLGSTTMTLSCVPDAANPDLASIPVTPPPTVTGISPTSGPTSGGTSVTITGSGFTGATAVDFGSTPAPAYTVVSDTSITATSAPASAPGPVDVTVTGPGGTSATSPASRFTYGTPPAVLQLFPDRGPTRGYALVWIFGRDLTGLSSVTFGGHAALFRVFSPELLIALAPPAASPGTVDVTLTGGAGSSATTPADQYTYVQQRCWFFVCFG